MSGERVILLLCQVSTHHGFDFLVVQDRAGARVDRRGIDGARFGPHTEQVHPSAALVRAAMPPEIGELATEDDVEVTTKVDLVSDLQPTTPEVRCEGPEHGRHDVHGFLGASVGPAHLGADVAEGERGQVFPGNCLVLRIPRLTKGFQDASEARHVFSRTYTIPSLTLKRDSENPRDDLEEALAAAEDTDAMLTVIARDAHDQRARGDPVDIDRYQRLVPDLLKSRDTCHQILIAEFVHRGEETTDSVRSRLIERYPELAEQIELAGEFCELAEAAEDDPLDCVENYDLVSELGRGAFGVVWKAWDRELRRFVALKLLELHTMDSGEERAAVLDEARSAAAIDHPNVVQVHRAGYAAESGQFFIDSQLVTQVVGDDPEVATACSLDEVHGFQRLPSAAEAARIVLQVCRGVAAAHAKRIVHRDLKPANVILSPAGRPMVTDFGLASTVRFCVRTPDTVQDAAFTLMSRSDGVVGTPAFMAPEQARGEAATTAIDVYGLGATLAWLLTGRTPFEARSELPDPVEDVLGRVRSESSRVLDHTAHLPRTLVAIARKAMAFDPRARYDSAEALAADLSNFLDQRPSSVDPPSVWFALKKAVDRNRTLSVVIVVAFVLVGFFLSVSLYSTVQRIRHAQRTQDIYRFDNLVRDRDHLWPRRPERLVAMREWLRRARALLTREPIHRQTLEDLEAATTPRLRENPYWTNRVRLGATHESLDDWRNRLRIADAGTEAGRKEAELAKKEIANIERRLRPPDLTDEQWKLDVLVNGLPRLAKMVDAVAADVEFAATIERRTIVDQTENLQRCIAAVRTDPRFRGFALQPVVGLVPLGTDPISGLQEFAHVETGGVPVRDAMGKLGIDEASAIVFVLLPGTAFMMGAESDPKSPNYFAGAEPREFPRHLVTLSPYLLSKFEMTQAQWRRATGIVSGPSTFPGFLHPVESIRWEAALRYLARFEMTLPTEAQWEFAIRGGKETIWYTGDDVASLRGKTNLRDAALDRAEKGTAFEKELADDGFPYPAPVTAIPPNPYGLHAMVGNVAEWCLEWCEPYSRATAAGSGRRIRSPDAKTKLRLIRGASWDDQSFYGRSSARRPITPGEQQIYVGVRPCMRLGPTPAR
jgi:serine/threonine protein kinase/formylglycine-generating enzyme required for sulfatase activity